MECLNFQSSNFRSSALYLHISASKYKILLQINNLQIPKFRKDAATRNIVWN